MPIEKRPVTYEQYVIAYDKQVELIKTLKEHLDRLEYSEECKDCSAKTNLPQGSIGCRAKERIKELEEELKQHRWIPVSERLPEKRKKYFKSKDCFVTDGKTVWVAAYNFSAYYWQYPSSEITHWKPIKVNDNE